MLPSPACLLPLVFALPCASPSLLTLTKQHPKNQEIFQCVCLYLCLRVLAWFIFLLYLCAVSLISLPLVYFCPPTSPFPSLPPFPSPPSSSSFSQFHFHNFICDCSLPSSPYKCQCIQGKRSIQVCAWLLSFWFGLSSFVETWQDFEEESWEKEAQRKMEARRSE